MYLLLILLISPAFGRPSSGQLDVGAEISNQLDIFTNFNKETGKLLLNSEVIENVVKMLLEAEKDILEMQAELKTLETQEIQFNHTYFKEYNEAKSYLRESRQGLRKLAHRTVTDVRDLKILLEALDETNDTIFLKISINRMKDLMVETLETLKEAKEKYNSAVETFENLNSYVTLHNRKLEKMSTKGSDEYEAWTARWRAGTLGTITASTTGCIIADIFGALGACSVINAGISAHLLAEKEKEIVQYMEKLRSITGRMMKSGNKLDEAINVAIAILTEEIELITIWNQSAKTVSNNIDQYPVEFLRKYKSVRNIFISGLEDLKNAADKFLDQPKDILNKD